MGLEAPISSHPHRSLSSPPGQDNGLQQVSLHSLHTAARGTHLCSKPRSSFSCHPVRARILPGPAGTCPPPLRHLPSPPRSPSLLLRSHTRVPPGQASHSLFPPPRCSLTSYLANSFSLCSNATFSMTVSPPTQWPPHTPANIQYDSLLIGHGTIYLHVCLSWNNKEMK